MQGSGRIGGWLNLHTPGAVAANSRPAIAYALGMGVQRGRLHFVPNVVDTTDFRPGGAKTGPAVTLLIAGRLGPEKRVDRFLNLMAHVRAKQVASVRGLIAGDGPLRKSLEDCAGKLGLVPPVLEFRGPVSEMTKVYRESDILVLTSDSEGTPNVLLEASSSGLPIVASRAGGASDVVRDGETGFLYNAADEDELVSAVLRLVSDSQLRRRLGEQGRRFVEENHSSLQLPRFLREFYGQILA